MMRGFTFFTNYASRKGEELRRNPRVALHFGFRLHVGEHYGVGRRQPRQQFLAQRERRRARQRGDTMGRITAAASNPDGQSGAVEAAANDAVDQIHALNAGER